jgi:hypothetical protein
LPSPPTLAALSARNKSTFSVLPALALIDDVFVIVVGAVDAERVCLAAAAGAVVDE